jgi:hypothetical protein
MFVRMSLYNFTEIAYHLFLPIYFSWVGLFMKCLHCACLVLTAVTEKEYYLVLHLHTSNRRYMFSVTLYLKVQKEITIINHIQLYIYFSYFICSWADQIILKDSGIRAARRGKAFLHSTILECLLMPIAYTRCRMSNPPDRGGRVMVD